MSGRDVLTNWQAQAWRTAKLTASFDAHKGMAGALRQPAGNSYELAPFAPMLHDGKWWIACNPDPDSLDGDVLLIDGLNGTPRYMADDGCGFYGAAVQHDQPLRLYTNGITFARDWAALRGGMYVQANAARLHTPAALDRPHMPGLVIVGDIAAHTDFADIAGAQSVQIDNPRARLALTDAMMRAARLPVVTVMQPKLRAVA